MSACSGRRVTKRYRALLCGRLDGDGWVDFPLEGGLLPARTRYAAVDHSPSAEHGWLTTVDLWPHTGMQSQQHCCSQTCYAQEAARIEDGQACLLRGMHHCELLSRTACRVQKVLL